MGFITIKALPVGRNFFPASYGAKSNVLGPFLWIIHMFILSEAGLPCLVDNHSFTLFLGLLENFYITTPTKVSIVELGIPFYYQFWALFVALFPIHCSIAPVK